MERRGDDSGDHACETPAAIGAGDDAATAEAAHEAESTPAWKEDVVADGVRHRADDAPREVSDAAGAIPDRREQVPMQARGSEAHAAPCVLADNDESFAKNSKAASDD